MTPVSGIISDLSFRAGEQVSISSYVSIVDLSRLHIEALVDEIDVVKLKIGDEVDISFDAYPADLIGGIATYIAPTSTDLQGVITYLVKFELEGYGELALKPGMTANVDVSITTATGVLSVPNDAILDRDGKSYVKLLGDDDRIIDVEVKTGYVSVDNTEITSGLTEGDRVVKDIKPLK
ncbi:MAG: efflux RND transporter periplasmic adaptor subunit [Actinobacteria bacterium]|nr:efflux RND transporter periplasmic adaptor subunit [Actinomycetota bacterium]